MSEPLRTVNVGLIGLGTVGGGVARAGDVLFDPLVKHFKEYAFRSCRETPIKAGGKLLVIREAPAFLFRQQSVDKFLHVFVSIAVILSACLILPLSIIGFTTLTHLCFDSIECCVFDVILSNVKTPYHCS